jgi:hypothetical protein
MPKLVGMDMEDLVLERKTVELLQHATNVRAIKIINGHKRGTIGQALAEEKVGTIIRARVALLQEFWKPIIMVSLALPCGGNQERRLPFNEWQDFLSRERTVRRRC